MAEIGIEARSSPQCHFEENARDSEKERDRERARERERRESDNMLRALGDRRARNLLPAVSITQWTTKNFSNKPEVDGP